MSSSESNGYTFSPSERFFAARRGADGVQVPVGSVLRRHLQRVEEGEIVDSRNTTYDTSVLNGEVRPSVRARSIGSIATEIPTATLALPEVEMPLQIPESRRESTQA